MSIAMDHDIKHWTAKLKSALVLDITQGKTTVAEASRSYDLSPFEVEEWVEDGKVWKTPCVPNPKTYGNTMSVT